MLGYFPTNHFYIYKDPINMRNSFEGLCKAISKNFQTSLTSGSFFIFINRKKDRLKILYWDRDGFVIWYKRLEKGIFRKLRISGESYTLMPHELSMLLEGLDLNRSRHETLLLK